MIIRNQASCDNGFLPSVKARPLIHSKQKKYTSQKQRRSVKFKLNINQQTEDNVKISTLIEEYYRRFKMETKKNAPLSVSINFKSFSQQQLEKSNLKIKQERMRAGFQKNKNRSYSQGSNTIQMQKKKEQIQQKVNLSAKTILHRLKSFPASQINYIQQLSYQKQVKQIARCNTLQSNMPVIQNYSYHSQTIQNNADDTMFKNFSPIGKKFIGKHYDENQMTIYQRINLKKYKNPMRNQFHTLDKQKKQQLQKNLTPWINQHRQGQNPEQEILLQQKSLIF